MFGIWCLVFGGIKSCQKSIDVRRNTKYETQNTNFKFNIQSNITQEITPASIKGQGVWPEFPRDDSGRKKKSSANALLAELIEMVFDLWSLSGKLTRPASRLNERGSGPDQRDVDLLEYQVAPADIGSAAAP